MYVNVCVYVYLCLYKYSLCVLYVFLGFFKICELVYVLIMIMKWITNLIKFKIAIMYRVSFYSFVDFNFKLNATLRYPFFTNGTFQTKKNTFYSTRVNK